MAPAHLLLCPVAQLAEASNIEPVSGDSHTMGVDDLDTIGHGDFLSRVEILDHWCQLHAAGVAGMPGAALGAEFPVIIAIIPFMVGFFQPHHLESDSETSTYLDWVPTFP